MKKLLLLLMFVNLIPNASVAQTSVWKVEKEGKVMYIGGTVHILRAEDFPLPTEFDVAYAKAETLIFETDMDKLNDPRVGQAMMAKAMYTDKRTLKSVLSEKVYNDLEVACTKLQLPFANLQKLKPSMVVLTMSVMQMKSLGLTSEGVDMHYFKKAKEEGKSLDYLETVDQQLDMLLSMGEGYEDGYVKYSLKELDKMEKELLKMIDSWKTGKEKSMIAQINDMEKMYPQLYKTLLLDRNSAWIPKLESYLESDEVEYVLVGTLHLHGKVGILSMLEGKGYNVTQLGQ
ncbi:TraB/GumN family protein [Flammeovirgaceae bacterium SG7u.111]|nr:TraB/GumN family protein [Flammeovirgaceae bacterium SG7u.132]WPO38035.1 TraB/GumN family protein [Flammeovirgaceae bacterium SG7u.111]